MAVVVLAHDLRHDRPVALKVLRPELAATVGVDRFLQEIRIAAKLTHPNILAVYDSGEADGFLYYVMPYVQGDSLRTRLDRLGQLPIEEALRISREVADGLAYAHAQGIVHRDVKPANILFEADHAVVSDFGIATAVTRAEAEPRTDPGMVVGTPEYMSPEQAPAEEEVDARSDVYALGCVLYEMLAGDPPFTGRTPLAILAKKAAGTVPSLALAREAVPRGVERAVLKALAVAPEDRFASVRDFGDALTPERMAAAIPAMSIAVLPFANLSGDPANEYLSDGLAEEITNALAKIQALRVASRTSAFVFKGRDHDVREIGQQLGVATVLEGSVRKAGERLRITAQLVKVADGYHLWSERFDRRMADVFAIEDEIAENITRALEVVLTDDEKRAIARAPTADINAYDLYLRGRQFFHQTRKKSLEFARQMFTRAIELDPGFALAHAGVADCCALLHMYYRGSAAELEEADRASRKALELDPDLAEAHAARGFALFQLGRHDEAEREFETAVRVDPSQFDARYFHARQAFQLGELEKAARLFEDASRVCEDYQARFFAAQSYAALGREAEADAAYRRALDVVERHLALNPDDARAATMCAVSWCRTGDKAKGLEWAKRALAIDPEDAGVRYNVACLYALEGEPEQAIACLEEALARGFGNRDWIRRDPDLASLRDHPRFQALVDRL